MSRARVLLGILLLLCPVAAAMAAGPIQVQIEGFDEETEADRLNNVRQQLSLHRFRDEEMSEARIRRLHARAPDEIRQALRPFGHYQVEVDRRLERTAEGWRAHYHIDPGPRVQLVRVDIRVEGEGSEDPVFRNTLEGLPLRENQPLLHQHYDQSRTRLQEIASRRGYLDAEITERRLRVDPELGTAEATIVMETGPRYRFGHVHFKQDILDESFLRRYQGFKAGEPFDADRLLGLQFGLGDSEYFDYVDIRPRRDLATEDLWIPIEVEMSPRAKHRYQAGIGYGTDTGPRVSARWDNRRINNRGHRGVLDTYYSSIRRSADLRYIIPLERPTQERLTGNLTATREDLGDIDSRLLQVGVSRTTLEGAYQRTTFLRAERERSIFNRDQEELSELLIPGVMWSRTRADDPLHARRGRSGSLELRGAREEVFFTDTSFARAHLRLRQILPLGERNRLLMRGELGAVVSEQVENLPASQRFFTGGDQSVRGFSYQAIGPRDDEGRRVGGRYLVVGSAEVDRRIRGDWFGAVFVDTGNAMNSLGEELKRSAGLGVRWASPIGMVRVDLARPFDRDDGNYRLHLTVGPDL